MKEQGKTIRLVHNPTAGQEDNNDEDELCRLIEERGHRCKVVQKEHAVKKLAPQTELIVVAGGDGTIKSTIIALLEKKLRYKRPIALVPQGTANNIAFSLNIPLDAGQAIDLLKHPHLKKFDVGMLRGLSRKPQHFVESIGFGIFPVLMEIMDKKQVQLSSTEEEIEFALKELRKLAETFPAKVLKLVTPFGRIKKKCIMVEVMNIASMGPQLKLAPDSDPGDGLLEIIMVTESQRQIFIDFIDSLLQKNTPIFPIKPITTNKLILSWKGKDLHIDDEIVNYAGQNLRLSLLNHLIEFVVQ